MTKKRRKRKRKGQKKEALLTKQRLCLVLNRGGTVWNGLDSMSNGIARMGFAWQWN